jgi:carbon monoxide dehydrogenase subunit G
MKFEGTVNINAPRAKVFGMLTDAGFVAQCAPGVREMVVIVPERKYQAVAAVGFGAVTTEFRTEVEFVERVPHERAKIKAHGNAPGSAVDVVSEMTLSDGDNGGTDLKWTADITIAGSIASLAARLMGPITRKMTGMFFDCVKSKIEQPD